MSADEKRCAFIRAALNGKGGISWRGFAQGAPTASELSKLTYSLRRSCTFDGDDHSTGCIEYRGRKLLFEVTDSALIVTATDEVLDPRSVAGMRPMVAIEQQKRAEQRAINTELHRKRFGR